MTGQGLFLAINWEIPFFGALGILGLVWLFLRMKAFSDWGKKNDNGANE